MGFERQRLYGLHLAEVLARPYVVHAVGFGRQVVSFEAAVDQLLGIARVEEGEGGRPIGEVGSPGDDVAAVQRLTACGSGLVYLDAFLLQNGQSIQDVLPAGQQLGDDWKVPPIPAEVFNVNTHDRDWVNRQCTAQSLATFRQPIHLTGALDAIKNVTFILASGWGPGPFQPFYEQAKTKGWKTLAIECGHDVMLDQPEALTEALLAAR